MERRYQACSIQLSMMVFLFSTAATGQQAVPQPAEAAKERAEEAGNIAPDQSQRPSRHVPAYAAPTTIVVHGRIAEDDQIGDYNQPRWTATRLFPTTRVYVVPAGTVQVEYWSDTRTLFSTPDQTRFRNLYELEMGLGHRLQLDLYLRTEQNGSQGQLDLESEKIELRYALTDWGVIPGNPTLYLELSRFTNAPATAEIKLLLGGNLFGPVHWGLNAVYERDLWGSALFHQYGLTGGLSYAVIDRELSVGAEMDVESTDAGRQHRTRLDELWVSAGPSIQWRPVPPVHLDLVALLGALGERQSDAMSFKAGIRPLLVAGWEI